MLIGMPVAGVGPLPSLPAPLPSLPLPTLPLPSLPVPSLPVPSNPLPSLPVPSNPLPSLPLPSGSGPAASDPAGPINSPAPTSSDLALPSSSAPVGAGGAGGPTVGQGPSPLQFVLPLLIAGIPIAVIFLIVILQVAGGAAWLPVIRRWLNRTPPAGP